jgi:sRNA-binding carbon storage regulator CsrA
MRIFTLKTGDSLVINGETVMQLVAIGDDKVRLRCTVPSETPINRNESYGPIVQVEAPERDRHD